MMSRCPQHPEEELEVQSSLVVAACDPAKPSAYIQ
jgi:hypothetical protein